MKLFDRIMDLNPEAAVTDNAHYNRYRNGWKGIAAGIGVMVVGLAVESLGVEAGLDIAAGGLAIYTPGMVTVGLELPKLERARNIPE